MKKFDLRTIFGGGLVLLGGLMLLEKLKILSGAAGLFFGAALFLTSIYFFSVFFSNINGRWWAIIPAMALIGMSINAILPEFISDVGGGVFLGALGLAFFIVYFTDQSRWWGIIPGGVLITLAGITILDYTDTMNTGSIFFLGLGMTFLLVALLPNPFGKMQWAYIPAGVLVLMGALMGSQVTSGLSGYVWPVAMILMGLAVIINFIIKKE